MKCLCKNALEDARLYYKRRNTGRAEPKLIDGTGARRRMKALQRLGWPIHELLHAMGYTKKTSPRWLYSESKVQRGTHERVKRLYAELSMSPGPSRNAAVYARAMRWPAPLDWESVDIDDPKARPAATGKAGSKEIDTAKVERAMGGERITLTRQERAVAIEKLLDFKLEIPLVAERLHLNPRTVERHSAARAA